jgi:hypothetical protein
MIVEKRLIPNHQIAFNKHAIVKQIHIVIIILVFETKKYCFTVFLQRFTSFRQSMA